MITKSEIIQKLREHSPLLKQYHVGRIGIFGSCVNDMQDEKSDIDLLVDFSDTISLFDYAHLADSLTSFMQRNVDLTSRKRSRKFSHTFMVSILRPSKATQKPTIQSFTTSSSSGKLRIKCPLN